MKKTLTILALMLVSFGSSAALEPKETTYQENRAAYKANAAILRAAKIAATKANNLAQKELGKKNYEKKRKGKQ